jgi:hypothetical protein
VQADGSPALELWWDDPYKVRHELSPSPSRGPHPIPYRVAASYWFNECPSTGHEPKATSHEPPAACLPPAPARESHVTRLPASFSTEPRVRIAQGGGADVFALAADGSELVVTSSVTIVGRTASYTSVHVRPRQ